MQNAANTAASHSVGSKHTSFAAENKYSIKTAICLFQPGNPLARYHHELAACNQNFRKKNATYSDMFVVIKLNDASDSYISPFLSR